MRYLARTADGRALLGDSEGFVPLPAALPGVDTVEAALRRAPEGLPDPADAPATRRPADQFTLAAPLSSPGRCLGIGLNYADHAADLDEVRPDEPASFLKPAAALTGPGGPIRLPDPAITDRVTAEAELGVVLGRTCSDVDEAAFDDVVAGFVPVVDLTAEDVLERNPRFLTRAKGFDTFLVVGPWVAVPDSPRAALDDVTVRTVVDDAVVAENTLDGMLFRPPELVAFHSRAATLEPGDLLSTGTPGAGVVTPDSTVRAEVDPVGTLTARVVRG
ncbi:fumarylacetoacetate hydrolase family protein [Halomarina litorea]|uniref:fumarylacetoacetate hydrolase family protein n=1 Tax=Halomarina litorea TaxID=2961595 RepID=UPI0020C2F207|nr:fumarylacetoacetate hydrolase family protein [Halomarina sp. BCD28]